MIATYQITAMRTTTISRMTVTTQIGTAIATAALCTGVAVGVTCSVLDESTKVIVELGVGAGSVGFVVSISAARSAC